MGCRLCKEEDKASPWEGEGGSALKFDGNTIGNGTETCGDPGGIPPASKTCEKLGVTAKQIFKLRQSWKGIKRNMEETGVEMFLRLFKSNASLKSMFHEFKDLTSDDELRSNEALENHATLVMTTLDDAITHIDNYDYVSEVLRKTGSSHVRFDGFKSSNFLNIREPFLDAVKITLGDRYTENMESIYRIAITFILQTMSDGIDEAHRKKAAS